MTATLLLAGTMIELDDGCWNVDSGMGTTLALSRDDGVKAIRTFTEDEIRLLEESGRLRRPAAEEPPCVAASPLGCEARRKLGIARGALEDARQFLAEAIERTSQPNACPEMVDEYGSNRTDEPCPECRGAGEIIFGGVDRDRKAWAEKRPCSRGCSVPEGASLKLGKVTFVDGEADIHADTFHEESAEILRIATGERAVRFEDGETLIVSGVAERRQVDDDRRLAAMMRRAAAALEAQAPPLEVVLP